MSGTSSRKVIIVEPRKILARSLEGLFLGIKQGTPDVGFRYGQSPTWQIRNAESVEAAMQFGFEPMEPEVGGEPTSPVFLLGSASYWNMIDSGKRLQACFPLKASRRRF